MAIYLIDKGADVFSSFLDKYLKKWEADGKMEIVEKIMDERAKRNLI